MSRIEGGKRTRLLQVRLTEEEYAFLCQVIDKNASGQKIAAFVRGQLFYKADHRKMKEAYADIRHMRVELHQVIRRNKELPGKASEQALLSCIQSFEQKLISIQAELRKHNGDNQSNEYRSGEKRESILTSFTRDTLHHESGEDEGGTLGGK